MYAIKRGFDGRIFHWTISYDPKQCWQLYLQAIEMVDDTIDRLKERGYTCIEIELCEVVAK